MSLIQGDPGCAQELELFEFDDFIDPIELRTTLSGRPARDRVFFASIAYAGLDRNYLTRRELIEADVGFVHVASSLFWSDYQMNVILEKLDQYKRARRDVSDRGEDIFTRLSVPDFNAKLQIARYVVISPSIIRLLASWNGVKREADPLDHEISFEVDMGYPGMRSLVGGCVFAWKPQELFIGTAHHMSVWRWQNGSAVKIRIGGGWRSVSDNRGLLAVREESRGIFEEALGRDLSDDNLWHDLKMFLDDNSLDLSHKVGRVEVIAEVRAIPWVTIPWVSGFHVVYSASFVAQSGTVTAVATLPEQTLEQTFRIEDDFWNHGIGGFIELPIVARLF